MSVPASPISTQDGDPGSDPNAADTRVVFPATIPPSDAPMPNRLSDAAARELARHEAAIERGLKTYIEVGTALLEIRDKRLYRETHDRFEDYLKQRWNLGRSHAYRQIDAAQVAQKVRATSPFGDVPRTEAQARELARIKVPAVLDRVVARVESGGGWDKLGAGKLRDLRPRRRQQVPDPGVDGPLGRRHRLRMLRAHRRGRRHRRRRAVVTTARRQSNRRRGGDH